VGRNQPLFQKMCLGLTCLFWMLGASFAQLPEDKRGIRVVPDREDRSCFQEADGYGYLGGDTTFKEVRVLALADAKRNAAEGALTFIRSKTRVENFEVGYDVVISETEAKIRVIEQKDYGIVDNIRYRIWIKAEVSYELQPKTKEPDPTLLMDSKAPLTVKLWTDKKRYREGEPVRIFVQGNKDFYGRVVNKDSTGHITQLLPNLYRTEHHFRGGEVQVIPGKEDRFDLVAVQPFGTDRIVVYASDVPQGEVGLRAIPEGKGLLEVTDSEEALSKNTRGIQVVGRGSEFYEAEWIITTSE